MTIHRFVRHLTPEDQAASRHLRLPFPYDGEGSFEVRLTYQRGELSPLVPFPRGEGRAAAVVDLGCEGPGGWRGWSGGAREWFTICDDGATPGYVGGGLVPGEYAVVLGLHRIPAEGVEVVVEVELPARRRPEAEGEHPPSPGREDVRERQATRRLPAPAGMAWYAGDFHAHSRHSDGTLPLPHLVAAGVGAGLDFLAVTEHNTVSHHALLPGLASRYGITLIPGQEVTTHRGHANAYGDIGFVDFREPAEAWRVACEERGGLLSVNHPLQDDCGWQYAERGHALELWHITWFLDLMATGPWALWERWDQSLPVIGGSDFHNPDQGFPLGTPTTWVLAEEDSPEALLAAVRAGRTAISLPQALGAGVLLRVDGELWAVGADGAVAVDLEGQRTVVRGERVSLGTPAGGGLVRLETPGGSLIAIG
ncbi:MAG TPA: CehA/McbA family metallohydrolase [Actinomycetales bacterium]|nr:CehA/McbA family metallohydrolase [Actinomycetales bacterium]